MGTFSQQVQLRPFNTFAVEAKAASFLQIDSHDELVEQLSHIQKFSQRLVLGGGSNLLFVGDYPGLIIYPKLLGINIVSQDENSITLSVGASQNWHDFVIYCLKNEWYGLENLALIPGTVGAAPVQNIGAYGVEIKEHIERVEYVDLNQGTSCWLNNQDCQFAYRDSVFKQAELGTYLITRVEFKLLKHPQLRLTYQPLAQFFTDNKLPSPWQVMQRVCEIRSQKLPDPKQIANAGSFFKNPLVSAGDYQRLKQEFPEIVAYASGEQYKLAAGWLIEKAGFKGLREGEIGVHKMQALVLVNYAEKQGIKIWQLAQKIQCEIRQLFGVELEPEVRVIGPC